MPGTAFKFDELSAGQILGDEVAWQVSPAEAGLEQVALGAEVVDLATGACRLPSWVFSALD